MLNLQFLQMNGILNVSSKDHISAIISLLFFLHIACIHLRCLYFCREILAGPDKLDEEEMG